MSAGGRIAILRRVRFFEGLEDRDLEQLCEGSEDVDLATGETLFVEGDSGDRAYVITDGELEIVKRAGDREVLLAVRKPPEVIGEMALLEATPRTATARARTAARVLTIPKPALDALLATSPAALRAVLDTTLGRLRESQAQLQQGERMQQLGTLAAGVAHELNNPASAVQRSAAVLRADLARQPEVLGALAGLGLSDEARAVVDGLLGRAQEHTEAASQLDALAQSDLEAEIDDWLADHDVPDAYDLSPGLVHLELGPSGLDELAAAVGPEAVPTVLRAAVTVHDVHDLVEQIETGAHRISDIVAALKGYSYLDQAPVQDVDVTEGIDNTLLLLGGKTKDIVVRREYAPDLPRIEAYGGELNQVWTNLLDNAADALREGSHGDPTIVIRAAVADRGQPFVAVEVEDNGPGIPPEIQERVFDQFFTTKPPGSGTGLGLDTAQRIVVLRHRGDITLESAPGRTVFRVELPTRVSV
jgi:signal transduction histidine kinase